MPTGASGTPACFAQEGTASTFAALASSVRRYGRCCELYPDRGSHFCTTQQTAAETGL
jgi:hypothetical protein